MKGKTKTVRVGTRLPAPADTIWEKLRQIETLQYIAAPYAMFKPAGNGPLVWEEGGTAQFHLKLFGFIPFGVHTICIRQFDKSALSIYSTEHNKYVPVWNHRIALHKAGDGGMSDYSDEVEIYAGWTTPAVALWCRLFYRHRQKKWLKLLE